MNSILLHNMDLTSATVLSNWPRLHIACDGFVKKFTSSLDVLFVPFVLTFVCIRYLKSGPGNLTKDIERKFSYALSREDVEKAILAGP